MKKKKWNHSFLPILLVILAVLLLLGIAFSNISLGPGKAIAGNQGATIELTRNGNTLLLSANIGSIETNGIYVEIDSSEVDLCPGANMENRLGWNEGYETQSCTDRIIFSDAVLNPSAYKTGNFDIAFFTFPALPDSFTVTLNPLSIYETNNGDDLFTASAVFTFASSSSTTADSSSGTTQSPSGSSSGGGGGGGAPTTKSSVLCTEDWTCSSWSACSNAKESRQCTDKNACATVKLKPVEERNCESKENTNEEIISAPEPSAPQVHATSPTSPARIAGIVASVVAALGLAAAGLWWWRKH